MLGYCDTWFYWESQSPRICGKIALWSVSHIVLVVFPLTFRMTIEFALIEKV